MPAWEGQMHVNSPDLAQRQPRLEAFRKTPYLSIPEAGWKSRFASMTPAAATDPVVVETFAKAAVQVEVQTPTGPQLDMVTLMPMLNPKLMPVPTMLIHSEYDDVADLDRLLPFFQQQPNPYKLYVVIPNTGHMCTSKAAIACSSMRWSVSSRRRRWASPSLATCVTILVEDVHTTMPGEGRQAVQG